MRAEFTQLLYQWGKQSEIQGEHSIDLTKRQQGNFEGINLGLPESGGLNLDIATANW